MQFFNWYYEIRYCPPYILSTPEFIGSKKQQHNAHNSLKGIDIAPTDRFPQHFHFLASGQPKMTSVTMLLYSSFVIFL